MHSHAANSCSHSRSQSKYVLRVIGLGYLTVLVGVPVGLIFWRTFENGIKPVLDSLTDPSVLHAFRVTAIIAFWAVILNTIFGVGLAILLVRHRFPGRRLLNVLIDLPIAVSPVVVGLALILVYGRFAPVGGWLDHRGVKVIFAYPGMVLATMFFRSWCARWHQCSRRSGSSRSRRRGRWAPTACRPFAG
jgi:sulfate transport system permease protein